MSKQTENKRDLENGVSAEGSCMDWNKLLEEHGNALLLYARQWTGSRRRDHQHG